MSLKLGKDPVNPDFTIRHSEYSKEPRIEIMVEEDPAELLLRKPELQRLMDEKVDEYMIQERLEKGN